MSVLAIDPGKRTLGAAYFDHRDDLVAATYIENPIDAKMDVGLVGTCVGIVLETDRWMRVLKVYPGTVVFEWPRAYTVDKQKGDQNDLLPLAGVDVGIAMLWPSTVHVTVHPDEWKGQLTKEQMNARVWDRLSTAERLLVKRRPKGGLDHNMLDAIGIGLYHIGRLERKRVFG